MVQSSSNTNLHRFSHMLNSRGSTMKFSPLGVSSLFTPRMRLIPIVWTVLKFVQASPSEFVDPNCP